MAGAIDSNTTGFPGDPHDPTPAASDAQVQTAVQLLPQALPQTSSQSLPQTSPQPSAPLLAPAVRLDLYRLIDLHLVRKLTVEQIAEHMELPLETVRAHISVRAAQRRGRWNFQEVAKYRCPACKHFVTYDPCRICAAIETARWTNAKRSKGRSRKGKGRPRAIESGKAEVSSVWEQQDAIKLPHWLDEAEQE